MALLFTGLDYLNKLIYPKKIGENAHVEYTWSKDTQERIVQLFFQLTRTDDDECINKLSILTTKLLTDIQSEYKAKNITRDEYIDKMCIMYKLLLHTRDIESGKGECRLGYMLLNAWYNFHRSLGEIAFEAFILQENDMRQLGSWKDVKYMWKYYKNSTLINVGISSMVAQLKKDVSSDDPSLAAKWAPRESSSFGGMYEKLAIAYYPEFMNSAKDSTSKNRAIVKAKMSLRKILVSLNKKLDTVQIKQCANQWDKIDPSIQTSITMLRQKKAFLNLTLHGNGQRCNDLRRIECADNFTIYATKASSGEVIVKGKNVGMNDFTSNAVQIMHQSMESPEVQLLNAQWKDNSKINGNLGKMVAMVDTSGSMSGDPIKAAIALGIRISEHSVLGNRIMTFSGTPSWVDLDISGGFVGKVRKIFSSEWGTSSNFYKAFDMILDVIVANKIPAIDVQDMVLVILSDMQMNLADKSYDGAMIDVMTEKYSVAGKAINGEAYSLPHILFWNLRSTDGFPSLSTQKNTTMMSGFSPVLLNEFCDKGMSALENMTPWNMMCRALDKPRYNRFENAIDLSM